MQRYKVLEPIRITVRMCVWYGMGMGGVGVGGCTLSLNFCTAHDDAP